jgi:YidC/Oxa1 family membrane protein insertase
MDRKGILVLVVSFVLLLLWYPLINYLYPPKPAPRRATTAVTNLPASGTNAAELRAATTNVTAPPVPPQPTPAAPEERLVLENGLARYTFTSHGGGLRLVELKGYPESVSCRGGTKSPGTNLATLNTGAPLPVLALAGADAVTGDGVFKLTTNGPSVRAEKALPSGLTVVKEFRLGSNYLLTATVRLENRGSQPLSLPEQEWVVGTSTPLGPLDDGSLMGVFWHIGKGADHVGQPWFQNRTLGCLPGTPREQFRGGQTNVGWATVHNQFFALAVMPPTNVVADGIIARQITLPPLASRTNGANGAAAGVPGREWLFSEADLLNAGALAFRLKNPHDSLTRFLADQLSAETKKLLADAGDLRSLPRPLLEALLTDLNKVLRGVSVYHAAPEAFAGIPLKEQTRLLAARQPSGEQLVRLNRLVIEEAFPRDLRKSPSGYQASLVYPAVTLASGQSLERAFTLYAGPKEYKTLSRLGMQMQNEVDLVMEYGGFFGFFAKLLLLSMNGLHSLMPDVAGFKNYGVVIIVITVIIKLLFWPLTNISTRSMKRMQALQPQMKALQEKYKDDPQKMQRKLWEFYKEHKINPAAGCLPVLVQMPIFIGFYQMIRTAIELRGARFLWNCDLSQPDTLFIVPGLEVPFNLLPLLMGATMLWQARLTPVSPGMDPVQQKIMKYMPLMFLAILYNFSAGLTLYWTVQNLLSIAQMKLTRTQEDTAAKPATPVSPALPAPVPAKKKKK